MIVDINAEQAEQAVLGALLIEGELIKETPLTPRCFGNPRHKMIFDAMKKADEKEKAVDLVSVVTMLGDAVNEVGGVTYISDLANSVPTTANFSFYEETVLETFRIRESRNLAVHFSENPTDEGLTEMIDKLARLQEINTKGTERTKRDVLVEVVDDMHEEKGEMTGIDTGSVELNRVTGGLQRGDLIIVAARPSMGKTAFALSLGSANCKKGGTTDIFSLEMGDKQLVHRLLSAEGKIDGHKWRNPARLFNANDFEKAIYAVGVIDKWDINIYDRAGQTINNIRAAIRKSMRKSRSENHLVVIDYLQLITPTGKFERNDLAVGYITRQLKKMAREFNIPIVLLSQLSRGVEQRQDKRPMLSDLRDSGNIEQDADIVMFLYRDAYYNADTEAKNITEIIIAKHRNGDVGKVEMAFLKEYGQFLDLDRRYSER